MEAGRPYSATLDSEAPLPDCANAPSAMLLEHAWRNAASIALPIELPMLWLCLKPAPSMQAWLPNSPPRCVSVVDQEVFTKELELPPPPLPTSPRPRPLAWPRRARAHTPPAQIRPTSQPARKVVAITPTGEGPGTGVMYFPSSFLITLARV